MSIVKHTPGHRPRTQRLVLGIYQVLLLLIGSGYLVARLLRGRGIPGFRVRLGCYSKELTENLTRLSRPIWIHLVSVGEVMAAQPLVEELRKRLPGSNWVITTVTPTGQTLARRFLRGPQDQLLYLPWDFSPSVHRAIQAIQPRLFITLETEIWPLLFHSLFSFGVPILIVNGRISPAAFRRYLWVRPFLHKTLSLVDFLLVQSPQDARRYAAIGAPKDRILVTGNIKWDLRIQQGPSDGNALRNLLRLASDAVLWTAGSTHPGEEKLILEVFRRLKVRYPSLRLLLAPRHPERIAEVEGQARNAGFSVLRRSQLKADRDQTHGGEGLKACPPGSDAVVLLDTLGELTKVYQISDLVFVGGSLVPHGGHNLVEPAAFRRPILTGPHLGNFQEIAESLLRARGMERVGSAQDLEERLRRLIEDPGIRQALGERAYQAIQAHRGALNRTAEWILARYQKVLTS